jgi:putative tryptophan/tyrosine transport system substrate-binding protein
VDEARGVPSDPPPGPAGRRRRRAGARGGLWAAAGAGGTEGSRIGYVSAGSGADETEGFRQGLAVLGYVEGRTVIVEWRDPQGQVERLPGIAAELVGLGVDVLVAGGAAATRALMQATDTIPIVMANTNNPVGFGFVASLARPGGNVTGLSSNVDGGTGGKNFELLKETVPGVSRVGVLWNPDIAERAGDFGLAEAAAGPLGLDVRSLEATTPSELEAAFERALVEQVEALYLFDNILLTSNPGRVGAFALAHGLPTIAGSRSYALSGILIAYGVSRLAQGRRAAVFVDKILKGARPADLPVEQPREFDFVINLKTAQALGLTISQHVLLQATEVIQ